MEGYKIDAV